MNNDVMYLTKNPKLVEKINLLALEYNYSLTHIEDLSSFIEDSQIWQNPPETKVLIMDLSNYSNMAEVSGLLQVCKQMIKFEKTVVLISKDLEKNSEEIKELGIDFIFSLDNALKNSQIDFILIQEIKFSYVSIKNLPKGKSPCIIYHLISHRGKFVPLVYQGEELSEYKKQKTLEVKEFFIKKEDFLTYTQWEKTENQTSDFYNDYILFNQYYVDLIYSFIDVKRNYKVKSIEEKINQLYTQSLKIKKNIQLNNVCWLIQQAVFDKTSNLQRIPQIWIYSQVFPNNFDDKDLFYSIIFSDLGLLNLDSQILYKIRHNQQLSLEEKEIYQSHPLLSLSILQKWGVFINQEVKKNIACSHEIINQQGFPNKVENKNIPLLSEYLRFLETIDNKMQIKLGDIKPDFKKVYYESLKNLDGFSFEFKESIKKVA